MSGYPEIESLFATATPPRSGSTGWYDACELLRVSVGSRLRDTFGRGFLVEVYGDEVGLILRVRGDGYGVGPWSVDCSLDSQSPLGPQIEAILPHVKERVTATYLGDAPKDTPD